MGSWVTNQRVGTHHMVSGTVLTCVPQAIQTSLTTVISIPKLLSGWGHFTLAGQLIFVLFT